MHVPRYAFEFNKRHSLLYLSLARLYRDAGVSLLVRRL